MNKIIIFLLAITLVSCSAEQRIKEHSYTNFWYLKKVDSTDFYKSNYVLKDRIIYERYQVYQTRLGKKYIIVLNKKQTKLKRQYIYLYDKKDSLFIRNSFR
jgi:hypothetical protein